MTAPPGVVSGESPSAHGVAIPPHLPAQGMSQDASPREAVSVLVCFASRSRLLVPSGLRPSGLLLLYSGEFSSLSSAFSGFPSEALVGHVLEPLPLSSRLSFCEVLAFCAVLHRYLVESPSGSRRPTSAGRHLRALSRGGRALPRSGLPPLLVSARSFPVV